MRWMATAVLLLCFLVVGVASAHLCNDVFAQARDNLAVKVDIRDGQLRVGDQASFRVYLLNTMDRDIERINLAIEANEFDAQVQPSASWKGYPSLKSKASGGGKEYFTVTLKRKPGVPDGKYVISLRIVEGGKGKRVFKVVDLEEAAGILTAPKTKAVTVDGKADKDEWEKAAVCTDLYVYEQGRDAYVNKPAKEDARFRVLQDGKSLYCLMTFQGGQDAVKDQATVYIAKTLEDAPVAVSVDRLSGKVECSSRQGDAKAIADAVTVAVSPDKMTVECKIPFAALGFTDAVKSFRANFTRKISTGRKEAVQYWRGNSFSYQEPVVYGLFQMAE